MLYGRRALTTAALTWGYYGGVVSISGTPTQVANGTVALTASATNHVEADPATGAVSANTAGFTAGRLPLYQVVAGASTVTSYTDLRVLGNTGAATTADVAAAIAAHEAVADPHSQYVLDSTVGQANGVASLDSSGKVPAAQLPATTAQPFDVHAFYPGIPTASAKVTRIPFARAVSFQANFAGSYFTASVGAAGTAVFNIQKNGVSIGSVSIAAGGTTATFTTTSGAAQAFAAGDVLSIIAPSTPDATLADAGFVLAGTR